MKDQILLTGGLGFIGHNLALHLKSIGLEPVVLDNFTQNIKNNWHRWVVDQRHQALRTANIQIIPGDTRVVENIRHALLSVRPTRIVHLSAIPSVVLSNQNPGAALDHNVIATKNMLEVVRESQLPLKQFVFFSSSTVYGDFLTETVSEEAPTTPKGIYEAAKLSCEIMLKAYHNLLGLPYTIIRPSALYGRGCINNRVSQIFIEQALLDQPLTVEDDGREKLDFTYINDLVSGVTLALQSEKALNQTFNLTYGEGRSIITLIDVLREYFPRLNVKSIARDKMKPKRGTLEIEKARTLLGYLPSYNLETGYRNYIEWYLQSPFKDLMSENEHCLLG